MLAQTVDKSHNLSYNICNNRYGGKSTCITFVNCISSAIIQISEQRETVNAHIIHSYHVRLIIVTLLLKNQLDNIYIVFKYVFGLPDAVKLPGTKDNSQETVE